jgi:hypothetical protein
MLLLINIALSVLHEHIATCWKVLGPNCNHVKHRAEAVLCIALSATRTTSTIFDNKDGHLRLRRDRPQDACHGLMCGLVGRLG